MKKNRKHILQKMAEKSALRKVRFRRRKRIKNRARNQMSKKKRLSLSDKYETARKLSPSQQAKYRWIITPSEFSLSENTDESLEFISKINKSYHNKKKVFVNTLNTKEFACGAIVVLLSILVKFKANKISFNGNYPKDRIARNTLQKSGFFHALYGYVENQAKYTFGNGIFTHANKTVDQFVAVEIIKKASKHVWGAERRCRGLYCVFIELMQNTNNHASSQMTGEHHWWASVSFMPNNAVKFAFIDYGIGIFESLERKKPGQTFFGIFEKVKSMFNKKDNCELLELLLNGKIHEMTNHQYNRGKGLPGIFNSFKNNDISNLVIISNDAKADCQKGTFTKLKHNFSGTFVSWELNINCNNII